MILAEEPAIPAADITPSILPPEAFWVFGGIGVVVLFFPAFIAALRGHRSTLAIGATCLFFGWTVIGWLLALVWSLASTGRAEPVSRRRRR